MNCVHCSGPVDPSTGYRRIQGWARRASAQSSRRGGEDIVLREHLDEWACFRCVGLLRDGLAPSQGALL